MSFLDNFGAQLDDRVTGLSGASPNSVSSKIFNTGQQAIAPAKQIYDTIGALGAEYSPGRILERKAGLSPEEQFAINTAIRLGVNFATGGAGGIDG